VLDHNAELRHIVQALDNASVTYAVVGGLAVSIYTVPRATEDIDLLLAREDLGRAIIAISSLGFQAAGQPMKVAGGRLEIQRLIKIAGSDILPLDLVIPTDPDLARLLASRVSMPWEERQIWIVDLSGLRILKRLRGSAQDRADLEALGPESS
jgi:hypothetical protein